MRKQAFATGLLVSVMLFGCDERGEAESSGRAAVVAGTTQTSHSALLESLVKRLEAGQDIAPLMSAKFEFTYHADSRCDGTTAGTIHALPAAQIDGPIRLQVTNDGQAWLCETRSPSTFELAFDLKAHLSKWDRYEATLDPENAGSATLEGGGQSDYLLIRFSDDTGATSISTIEYRSEDPG